MAVRTGQRKWQGSAADYLAYAQEDQIESAEVDLKYHDRPSDGVVFDMIGGKALDHLPGLDRSIGLTKDQHADLHAGRWNGVEHLKPGYQKQWIVDERGNEVRVPNPDTGKKERVPKIDEKTGKQEIKMVHTAGYDVTYSYSKDISEYLIAHPEDTELVQGCLRRGAEKSLEIAVEKHARIVRVPVAKPSEIEGRTTKTQGSATERQTADGIMYWMSFGAAARPTKESIERGYGADPLNHIHCFVSSMVWKNDKWYTLDGAELMKTADFRRDVADVQAALELEAAGFELEYAPVDRKGRITWTIKGTKAENREFLSTNSKRRHELVKEYEDEHNFPPHPLLLDRMMQATKGVKSEQAKMADRGTLEQYELWAKSMKDNGLEIEMPKRSGMRFYLHESDRVAELHRRLEAQEGLNRYADDNTKFIPRVVLPATMRAGMGLGFTPERLEELAADYLANHLITVRPALDPEARYLTTHTIKSNEEKIEKALDRLAQGYGPAVRSEVVSAVVGQDTLDAEQTKLVRAICSSSKLVVALGPAGSGKGRALKVATKALRETEDFTKVVVTAVAAQRAAKLSKDLLADRGGSVESLYRQWENGFRPDQHTVIYVDEAATLNTFDMARIVEIAGGKAKVVLAGDISQSTAIGVSGWLEHEIDKREPIYLHEVHRQPDVRDRDMLKLVRDGRSELAVHELDARNRIFISDTAQSQVAAVVGRYAMYADAGRPVAIVHVGLNEELDSYNRGVQRYRSQKGDIDLTESYLVSESSSGRRWTLAKGDRITFLEPVYPGLQTPVRNGECGEILKVDSTGRVRIRLDGSDRRTVSVHLQSEMHRVPIGLEYCQAAARYQGNEVDVVLCTQGSPGVVSQNSIYSQLSRMQTQCEVFVDQERWSDDPRAVMGEVFARKVDKTTATDYMRTYAQELNTDVPEMTFEEALSMVQAQREDADLARETSNDMGWGL